MPILFLLDFDISKAESLAPADNIVREVENQVTTSPLTAKMRKY